METVKIPRFTDSDTGIPYELYWKCTKCGWCITVNNYEIGKEYCRLCGAPTSRVKVNYPMMRKDGDITGVL
jgi:hypothetical protein